MAMQGLAVVPLFAGYDLARGTGRIFTYDVTGGHYEDTDFQRHRVRRPRRPHDHQARLPDGLAGTRRVELAIQSLYEAADEDSATGGPDLVRGIYPLVATVTAEGYRAVPEDEVAERFAAAHRAPPERRRAPAMTMPYYVAPEQVMKDRAEYAQKGIARGRSLVATTYDLGIVIVAENPSRSLHKISEIYDRIAFAGVGKYNEYDQLRVVGRPPRRHQGVRLQPRGRRRPVAGQSVRPVPGQRLHPRDEAARGRDPGGRARRRPRRPAVPHRLRGHDHRRGPVRRARW